MPTFELATEVPCSAEELWTYHARPGALSRLTPPFDKVRAVSEVPALEDGARAIIEMAVGPVWTRWVALHERVVPGRGFVDVMEAGPFKSWRHEHLFEPRGSHAVLIDRITYEAPGSVIGEGIVEGKLARTFAWRHKTTCLDAKLLHALRSERPLVVGITGATGLIGRELTSLLRAAGHEVKRFARGSHAIHGIPWNASTGEVGPEANGLDAVVHLAGEPVAENRLDDAHKERVRQSRVDATDLLVRALAGLEKPPRAFISASAVGYYGTRGDEVLHEDAPPGTGFLADVCVGWEKAALAAQSHGMRAAAGRIGFVLSPAGGGLEKMLLPFKAGMGARLGDGRQWMPVVSVDDVAAMFYRAIVDERVTGAFNAVGPEPVKNERFTHLLGHVLGRAAPFSVPKFAAKALFGGALVDEALLASQRAVPSRLFSWGHEFRHPTAEDALRHVLGRPAATAARPGTTGTRPSSVPRPPAP